MWPTNELPNFQSTVVSFYRSITDLALRILTVVAIGLELVSEAFALNLMLIGSWTNLSHSMGSQQVTGMWDQRGSKGGIQGRLA